MTDLPELPGQLDPRTIDLPFELTDEHLQLYLRAYDAVSDTGLAAHECRLAALTEVVKLVWLEHVLPIEQALEASERDVADMGRKLHAALNR